MLPFRRPFRDLIRRQLDLFAAEQGELLAELAAARRAWATAGHADAEERYADLLDAVRDARDALADVRDRYATTLGAAGVASYSDAFDRACARRWPDLAHDPDAGLFDDLEPDD